MSDTDREKWDRRYEDGSYESRTYPSPFLDAWLDRLPRGRALDLACGMGRNALRLAAAGYDVDAMDISSVALERARKVAETKGVDVTWIPADLDEAPLAAGNYTLITVIRYLNRKLVDRIIDALSPGGWLLFEHHMDATVPIAGPSDPNFRLRPQELLHQFQILRVIHYLETVTTERDGRRMALAQLVACKGDPGF